MDNIENTPNSTIKVPFDPGWNDPPNLLYNVQQTTPNRPRNFLNKRVAFPISGPSPVSQSPVNLPPIPNVATPAPPVYSNQKNIQAMPEEDIDIDSESTLKEVKNLLSQFLENSNEMGPKVNDIKRRISVMEEMWSSGKLNKKIYMQMRDLAYALRDDQPNKADEIHRALMVDHVSTVGTWMPGVKQLIHHCIARTELLAIDKE